MPTIRGLVGVSDSDALATDFEFVYDDRSQLQLERQLAGLVGTSVVLDRDYSAVGNQTALEVNFGGTLSGGSISGGVYDFRNSYAFDAMVTVHGAGNHPSLTRKRGPRPPQDGTTVPRFRSGL